MEHSKETTLKDNIDFGIMHIPTLFRKLLIPTVLGMVFSAIFIITDTACKGCFDTEHSESDHSIRTGSAA